MHKQSTRRWCELSAPHLGEQMVHDVGSNVVVDVVEDTVVVVTG